MAFVDGFTDHSDEFDGPSSGAWPYLGVIDVEDGQELNGVFYSEWNSDFFSEEAVLLLGVVFVIEAPPPETDPCPPVVAQPWCAPEPQDVCLVQTASGLPANCECLVFDGGLTVFDGGLTVFVCEEEEEEEEEEQFDE